MAYAQTRARQHWSKNTVTGQNKNGGLRMCPANNQQVCVFNLITRFWVLI